MSQAPRILVVDDEPSVRMMLEAALRAQGYRVQSVASGVEARDALEEEFDLLLLDLRLGDMDGIDILQETKARWPATEVILLTAHGSINSAIAALRHGAFDYLLKPAQVNDIRERVERGLARRRSTQQRTDLLQRISESVRALGIIESGGRENVPSANNSDRIEVGPLMLDLRRHGASLGKHQLALTRTEFALLTALAQQPDTALSYSALSEAVYGRAQPEDEARALLRPHIARLRHKLESTGIGGISLVSIRSMGYMLQLE